MKSLFTFYILVVYILFQFCWWTYLLIDQQKNTFYLKTENAKLLEKSGYPHEEVEILEQKQKMKLKMILGEASVFLLLLSWGAYRTRNTFKKEMTLSRQQKNFLLSITHEFKSPLASIKLYLQTFQKRDLDKYQKDQFIKNALSDVDRLNGLVENALFATQIERKNFSLNFENLNIAEIINNCVDSHIQNNIKKIKFHADVKPAVFLKVDKTGFTSMFVNVFENAIKYAPPESEIHVELFESADKITIKIKDNGAGIPDMEKQKVFEKFYRIGNEETRKSKGTGLGLFIAKYMAEQHNGKIIIKDNKPQGCIFEIQLQK